MTDTRELDHALMNYLAIILGYAEILLQESTEGDPRRGDFQEIYRAASEAVRLVNAKGDSGP